MSESLVTVRLSQEQDYRFRVAFDSGVAALVADEPAPLGGGQGPSPVELLAAVKAHAGALARIERFPELQGFLNTTPEFEQHAEVLDGASDLFAAVLGPDAGLHARSVVGVATLRKGLPLTIRAVLQLKAA